MGRSDAEKAAAARQLAERQRRYDRLHHQMRVAMLYANGPWWQREMLRQSKRFLDDPDAHGRCVDLNDSGYLQELDEFEAQQSIAAE